MPDMIGLLTQFSMLFCVSCLLIFFFKIIFFLLNTFRNTIRVSNSGLHLGYQQITLVGKEFTANTVTLCLGSIGMDCVEFNCGITGQFFKGIIRK